MSNPLDIFTTAGGGITKGADGSIIISAPAAMAAAQAPSPNGSKLVRPEMVAQVVVNVPLSKLERFLRDVQEMLCDDEWRGPAEGLVP